MAQVLRKLTNGLLIYPKRGVLRGWFVLGLLLLLRARNEVLARDEVRLCACSCSMFLRMLNGAQSVIPIQHLLLPLTRVWSRAPANVDGVGRVDGVSHDVRDWHAAARAIVRWLSRPRLQWWHRAAQDMHPR